MKRLLFRNFRLMYRLSQWLRHRLTPGGALVFGGVIVAGIFGIDTGQSLAYQVFAVMVSLLLVAVISTVTFRTRFRVRRSLPDYATVGQPLRYRLSIENIGRSRQRDLILIDELESPFPDYQEFTARHNPHDKQRNWFDRLAGYPRLISLIRRLRGGSIPVREIPPVPAQDRSDLEIEFIPARRGYVHFSSAIIARPDPLGLFRAMRRYPTRQSLLVLPHTYRIPSLHLPGRRKYQHGGMTLASHIGDSQEFLSLRDYQPGDPLRSIHWRSYAKRGQPIVKEFQDEFFVRQGLVLDTFLEDGTETMFEEAVSLAASFQLAMEQQDALVDLLLVENRSYCFTSGRGLGNAAHILEVLACIQPCRDLLFSSLHDLLLQHAAEVSGLIMILLQWDEKRRLMVQRLMSMGTPVVVILVTPGTGVAAPEPGPLAITPERLIPLASGRIQEDLDKYDWAGLRP
jgi:uncharacterized protein (DUF58 family)